ncbi:50S ribosomal protein L37ae [Candidatus Micrarchaeota archaeon]|nr:50S ribosomal protein L37ae [Candidatus Micrarchaeota archaeon]MBU1165537.1 50S ribosomal protein L37ae [Candidatus Micrarchaeota archaeon]MBU1886520.1 50S ribosomal protein L37ae [Candidatus Micrarchaeota archaeon]
MRSSRYGASIRKQVDKAMESKDRRHECPKCRKLALKRKSNAVWVCKSCGAKLAGATYSFESKTGQLAKRNITEYSTKA